MITRQTFPLLALQLKTLCVMSKMKTVTICWCRLWWIWCWLFSMWWRNHNRSSPRKPLLPVQLQFNCHTVNCNLLQYDGKDWILSHCLNSRTCRFPRTFWRIMCMKYTELNTLDICSKNQSNGPTVSWNWKMKLNVDWHWRQKQGLFFLEDKCETGP